MIPCIHCGGEGKIIRTEWHAITANRMPAFAKSSGSSARAASARLIAATRRQMLRRNGRLAAQGFLIVGFHSMSDPYLQALADLASLPDDATGFARDLMEGTLALERFYMLSAENDEQRNNIIRRFVRVSEVLRSGALIDVELQQ